VTGIYAANALYFSLDVESFLDVVTGNFLDDGDGGLLYGDPFTGPS
jgi:hypothetical protein